MGSKAKASSGGLTSASPGNGTSNHMALELLAYQSGVKFTHVPYKGSGPAVQDVMGGQVDMMFDGLGSSAAHIKAGRIKALMVSGPKRNPAFPDVPCAAEVGLPAYDVHTWYGIWAPKGTPADAQAAAIEAIRKACQEPESKTVWAGQGADFPNVSGERFAKLIHTEIGKWAQVVKLSGAKLE